MITKKILTTLLLAFLINTLSFSQEFEVVPKVGAIEAGIRFIPHSSFGIKPIGWNVQADMAWQVSGFKEKAAAFISVPLGFGKFNGGGADTSLNATTLHYGWTIRHNLARDKKFIPFVGYSLLLNQLWLKGTEGHTIGHETRFDFGFDIHPEKIKLVYMIKIEYSHITYPSLGKENSDRIEIFSLKSGIRF